MCLGVLVSYGGVILALCCQWVYRNVNCHGGVCRVGGAAVMVKSTRVCSECRTVSRSGPHRPCGTLGSLICKHLMMKMCWESTLFV